MKWRIALEVARAALAALAGALSAASVGQPGVERAAQAVFKLFA